MSDSRPLEAMRLEAMIAAYGATRHTAVDAIYQGVDHTGHQETAERLYGQMLQRLAELRQIVSHAPTVPAALREQMQTLLDGVPTDPASAAAEVPAEFASPAPRSAVTYFLASYDGPLTTVDVPCACGKSHSIAMPASVVRRRGGR